MIHTLLDWLLSPVGNVVVLAVLLLVIPVWGWKLVRDAVEPLDDCDPRRDRRG